MSALTRRELIPERMDDPLLDPSEHHRALTGLARLNRLSRSAKVLWPAIQELARERPGRTLRILDVATGSGDVPLALAGSTRRHGISIEISGCDISAIAIEQAKATAKDRDLHVDFFVRDALRNPLPDGFDIVTCSLFLHHLGESDSLKLLHRLSEAAGQLVLVNDLARSRFNFMAVWVACRLLSRSAVVHFDGPTSVRSAFKPSEALELAKRAGLSGAAISHHWPCRYLLKWRRPHGTPSS